MDRTDNYQWSVDFPQDCPPARAYEVTLTVYRFVKHDPPDETDFSPFSQSPGYQPKPEEHCSDCALSVIADPSEISVMRAHVPGFAKRLIAEGEIEPGHGLVENCALETVGGIVESHHDWWVPDGVEPLPMFRLVSL